MSPILKDDFRRLMIEMMGIDPAIAANAIDRLATGDTIVKFHQTILFYCLTEKKGYLIDSRTMEAISLG